MRWGGGDDGGESAGEAGAAEGVGPMLVASDYGPNTPTNAGVRRLPLDAKGIRTNIKHIKAPALREVVVANSAGELRKVSDVTYSTLPQQSPSAPMLNQRLR